MSSSKFNLPEYAITAEDLFDKRRQFLRNGAAMAVGLPAFARAQFESVPQRDLYTAQDKLTPFNDITQYNNFYEFSLDKEGPAKLASDFNTNPWSIRIEGECDAPYTLGYEDLTTAFSLEERIYRLRCVEAWSMVVPWVGFELNALLNRAQPNSRAKFVSFTTLHDPERMPGQKPGIFGSSLPWPYREGLRIDEAMHPLAIMAVGLYDKTLPNQNGAPIRLVVPWKYGFKSIKSIVKIAFSETMPQTTWNTLAANEYGFFANVNPEVDHPRWSQAKERRIGELFKRETLPFNGYGEWIANLYADMDLQRFY